MKSGYLIKRTVYVDMDGNCTNDISQAKLFKTAENAKEVARIGDEVKRVMIHQQSNQKWMSERRNRIENKSI